MVPIKNPPFAYNGRLVTVSVLCHLFAQNNADNTDNWNNAEIPLCAEIIDSSVSCWFFVLYKKTEIFFPEDFKSLAFNCLISSFIPNTYC